MNDIDNLEYFDEHLEDNIELRKAVTKLEDLLTEERTEKENIKRIHENFKTLHDKVRKECMDLNQKLIETLTEKCQLEKKYESDFEKIKNVKNFLILFRIMKDRNKYMKISY